MSFRCAVFDLDGTLACTLPDLRFSLNRTLGIFGFPPRSEQQVREVVNLSVADYIERSLPADKRGNKDLLARCITAYREVYAAHFCDSSHLYDGILPVLRELRAHGVYLAVHTNKAHPAACALCDKLAPGIFDTVVGDGLFRHKPDPEGVLHIAARAGVPLSETAFIGDSDVDMQTAVNAGAFPVGVAWGYRDTAVLRENGASVIAETPQMLCEILL